jgi:hypothetical protein
MDANLQDADGTLVVDGRVRTGAFRLPFRTPGLERADVFGLRALRPLLRLRQRYWFGFAVVHPEVYLATIVIDLGFATVSGLYVYERARGAYGEHTAFVVDPRRGRMGSNPWDDRTCVEAPGHRVAYRHRLDHGRHEVSIDIRATRDAPEVRAEFAMLEDVTRTPPLVVSVPATDRWFMYTHKAHAPAEGFVRVGGREYRLDPARDLANIDEHRAAYPYRQEWTWGTFGGRQSTGALLAANLCTNVNYLDPRLGNENRLWVDGRLDPLGGVEFRLDPANPLNPWHVGESAGRVDLTFTPDGARHQHTHLGPVRLDYFQAFGHYRGTVMDARGTTHEVKDFYGAAEQGRGFN